jgi:hypothetical protein
MLPMVMLGHRMAACNCLVSEKDMIFCYKCNDSINKLPEINKLFAPKLGPTPLRPLLPASAHAISSVFKCQIKTFISQTCAGQGCSLPRSGMSLGFRIRSVRGRGPSVRAFPAKPVEGAGMVGVGRY